MKNFNLSDLIAKAQNNTRSFVINSGSSKYSVSIVNNINGKRVTICKSLSLALSLDSTAYFLPVEETGQLLISASPIGQFSSKIELKGKDKKIAYSANLANTLTSSFKLNFTERTSCSFSDISLDMSSGAIVAIININDTSLAEDQVVSNED